MSASDETAVDTYCFMHYTIHVLLATTKLIWQKKIWEQKDVTL